MSRKYRQRGYQDNDSPQRSENPRGAPHREGPRGRGLGKPTAIVFRCARCGAGADREGPVETMSTCLACGADLHSCTNCRHFDAGAPMECRAVVAERIAKKSTRNECALFEIKQTVESSGEIAPGSDARSDFEALFKL